MLLFIINEAKVFPGTILVDVGDAGQFDDGTVQIPEQREILRLGRRRATNRSTQDHILFVGWSTFYESRYRQNPNEDIFFSSGELRRFRIGRFILNFHF